jgi:hypothetical protein
VGFGGEAMGLKPPLSSLGIPLWYPPVAHEAAAELKAQMEAKFHMYYFSLR